MNLEEVMERRRKREAEARRIIEDERQRLENRVSDLERQSWGR